MSKTKTTKATKKTYALETSLEQPTILVLGYGATADIRAAGGIAEACRDTDASAWLAAQDDDVSGLLLLGGGDVDPSMYNEERSKSVYGVNRKRDEVESTALSIARERGIPIMGICRGAQMMNVTAGGTLHQNITDSSRVGRYHSGCDTPVTAVRGSRLAKAFGEKPALATHIHHQACKDIAPGFVATAFTRDGVVEAIESVHSWELGVQFHPEMMYDRNNYNIFAEFVKACADYAGILDFHADEFEPRGSSQFGSGWSGWYGGSDTDKVTHTLGKPASYPTKIVREPLVDSLNPARMSCGLCNISRFDAYEDWIDHLSILHGIENETIVALEDAASKRTPVLAVKSAKESATVFEERM